MAIPRRWLEGRDMRRVYPHRMRFALPLQREPHLVIADESVDVPGASDDSAGASNAVEAGISMACGIGSVIASAVASVVTSIVASFAASLVVSGGAVSPAVVSPAVVSPAGVSCGCWLTWPGGDIEFRGKVKSRHRRARHRPAAADDSVNIADASMRSRALAAECSRDVGCLIQGDLGDDLRDARFGVLLPAGHTRVGVCREPNSATCPVATDGAGGFDRAGGNCRKR